MFGLRRDDTLDCAGFASSALYSRCLLLLAHLSDGRSSGRTMFPQVLHPECSIGLFHDCCVYFFNVMGRVRSDTRIVDFGRRKFMKLHCLETSFSFITLVSLFDSFHMDTVS